MNPGTPAPRPLAAALATVSVSVAVTVAGCGQVSVGEQAPDAPDAPDTPDTTGSATPGAVSPRGSAPPPAPGPEAAPGCETLLVPVHRLVHAATADSEDDRESISAEVRRLADGVDDNALSAVASRMSGLAVQPTVSPAAVEAQWEQFLRLCDLP